MAEEQDEASKTEEPTHKRLTDLRNRGSVPVSQDFKHFMMLLGALGLVGLFGAPMARDISAAMMPFLTSMHEAPGNLGGVAEWLGEAMTVVGLTLALPLLLLLVIAVASSILQNGLIFTSEPLKPSLNKINPMSGFKRLFSLQTIVELAKSILKLMVVGFVLAVFLWPELRDPVHFIAMPVPTLLEEMARLALLVLLIIVILQAVIAALDIAYQRWNFQKRNRMTKQEVKDEYKQVEGDPQIKARIRRLRAERARQRMMAAVPTADVVVTNPTHFAVALKYEPESMAAPKLVAKGADLIAARIREVAEENDVPVVENPPVARALFATVELDQEIPPEHYRAVAEIISYVFRIRRRLMPSRSSSAVRGEGERVRADPIS